ncbi:hypothetical protein DRO51_01385 [Candidatus Bathyarchaeota archaeon]|nr:MAG: hypothetical protein DRO51_01385 [Candidatus Bathyarchaeota archaeon]
MNQIFQSKTLATITALIMILSTLAILTPLLIAYGAVGTITASQNTITKNTGQVLMVTISDPDLTASDAAPPRLTCNKPLYLSGDSAYTNLPGNQIPVYQISGGAWVAFIAVDTPASGVPAAPPAQDPTIPSAQKATTLSQLIANPALEPDTSSIPVTDIIAVISASAGDTITLTYYDASEGVDVTVDIEVKAGVSGSISLDRDSYPPYPPYNAIIRVVVSDVDWNLDPTAKDTIPTNYVNITGLSLEVTIGSLTESGPNTGEFKAAKSYSDLGVTASRGATLTAKYKDITDYTASPWTVKYRTDSATILSHTGLLSLDKSEYSIANTATITLTEPDLNLDSADADSAWVNVTSDTDPSGINVTLDETGDNTGIFTGTFTFSLTASSDADDIIQVSSGDKVYVTYTDIVGGLGYPTTVQITATFATHSGTISLDRSTYGPGVAGVITVTDPDLNVDPDVVDTLPGGATHATPQPGNVYIWSSVEPSNYFTVLMVETGADTGIFTGTFYTSTTGSLPGGSPIIKVSAGSTIKAIYYDKYNSAGQSQKFEATASYKSNTGKVVLDETSYSPGDKVGGIRPTTGEIMKITVIDPDLNTQPLAPDTIPAGTVYIRGDRGGTTGGAFAEQDISTSFTETGPSTGEFTAKFTLPAAVQKDDVIVVTYIDALNEAGQQQNITASAIILPNTGIITVNTTEVPLYSYIKVTVNDPDWDLDPSNPETIPGGNPVGTWGGVDYWTSTTGKSGGVQIELRETGDSTGIFEKEIKVGTDYLTVAANQVKRGDTLYFRYNDDADAGGAKVQTTVTATVTATTGSIALSKSEYPLNGEVIITITDPDLNTDPASAQSISSTDERVWITTTSHTTPLYLTATETGPDTGVFEAKVTLNVDIDAALGDGITVAYKDEATADGRTDVTFTATAVVKQYTAEVSFDKNLYMIGDSAVITVNDPDANQRPDVIEAVSVSVYSDTDPAGVTITAIETGENTGIFNGTVIFTEGTSVGSKLQVSKGDVVTAKYTDETASPDDIPGWTPGIATRLVIKATAKVGVPVPVKPITAGTPAARDPTTGEVLTEVSAGSMILLSTDMTNTAEEDLPMLYIVQVKDEAGHVVFLSFISGTVPAGQTYSFGISWTPAAPGTYTVEVFAWKSWEEPTPLSDVATTTITVV